MKDTGFQLEVLYRISQALAHHKDVSTLLNEVLDILENEMGMQRGTVALRRPDSEVLVIEASKALTAEEMRRGQYKIGEGVTGKVAQSREPAVIPDITADASFLNRTMVRKGAKNLAFICVPIIRQNDLIGTISIDRPSGPVEDLQRDLAFLKIIANILAEAVAGIRAQIEEREALL